MNTIEELQKENELLKKQVSAFETQATVVQEKTNAKEEQVLRTRWIKLSISLIATYLLVVTVVLLCVIFLSNRDDSIVERIAESENPIVGVSNAPNAVLIRDTTDFSPSHEERIQIDRILNLGIPLSEIRLDIGLVEKFFAVDGRSRKKMLRFRIGLKNGMAIEAAVMRNSSVIVYSRVSAVADVRANTINCFRRALFGADYAAEVEKELRRNGVCVSQKDLTAQDGFQCLTDEEAWQLFQHVCEMVAAKEYDWGRMWNLCFLGMWDRNHPLLSLFALLGVGVLILLLNIVFRPIVEKVGRSLASKCIPTKAKRLLTE